MGNKAGEYRQSRVVVGAGLTREAPEVNGATL